MYCNIFCMQLTKKKNIFSCSMYSRWSKKSTNERKSTGAM